MKLSERLLAGEGPDRELDAEIVRTICPGATVGHYTADDDGDIVFHAAPFGISDKSTCPTYTASLEAALTLYPNRPDTMPTNPRKAAAEALEQRGL